MDIIDAAIDLVTLREGLLDLISDTRMTMPLDVEPWERVKIDRLLRHIEILLEEQNNGD